MSQRYWRSVMLVSHALSQMVYIEKTNYFDIISSRKAAIVKNWVDKSVNQALKHEINSVAFSLENSQLNTSPDYFPFKDIHDNDYDRKLTLQKEFADGEIVTLMIDTDIVKMNEIEWSNKEETLVGDKEENESKKDLKTPLIPVEVEVCMPDIKNELHFRIAISKKNLIIQRCKVLNKEDKVEIVLYKFEELNPMVQPWLYKYLEVRGISSNITSDLIKIIAKHIQKVDLRGLKLLDDFIKSADTC